MGTICPCLKKKKRVAYPYDVHQQTFEMQDQKYNIVQEPQTQEDKFNSDNDSNLITQTINKINSQNQSPQKIVQVNSKDFIQLPPPKQQSQSSSHTLNEPTQPKKSHILQGKGQKKQKKKFDITNYRFLNQKERFLIRKPNSISQQQFNIECCYRCSLYIFDITANVYIDDTQDSLIFIAPCESTVFVRNCRNILLIAASKQFRMYNCHNCTFSLYCASQVAVESSSLITLTSFDCAEYTGLAAQFHKLKLSPWNNHWSEPHDFTKKESETHYQYSTDSIRDKFNFNKAFGQADLEIINSSSFVPFTYGQISYERGKEVMLFVQKENQESIRGKIGEYKLVKSVEKDKQIILHLDVGDKQYQQLGEIGNLVLENIKEIQDKYFITFKDQRES